MARAIQQPAADPSDRRIIWFGLAQVRSARLTGTIAELRADNPQAAIAVKVGGKGDVDATHVLWRQKTAPGISSPLVVGKQLCWVNGSVVALDLADGKPAYNQRLYDARGEYVSPVAADGRISALTRLDGMYVLSADGKYENLSHYAFPGDTSIFNALLFAADAGDIEPLVKKKWGI